MRQEASRVLREKAPKIAEALGNNAEKGNVQSVTLLLKLSDKNEADGESGEDAALARSRATALASEPEWKDPALTCTGDEQPDN